MRWVSLDRYLLELLARPVAAALGVTLVAQLLDRILKLINQLAENGAHFGFLFQLTVNLVPYYLTFSLPASFFVAIFLVVAQMGDGNEIDAILASGVSITRFAAPFLALGVIFAFLSLVLFGFLQPYGRYAYAAVFNSALNAGWDAQLQPEVFTDPGHGLTITADRVAMSGRAAQGVFIRRVFPDGREQITTASSGALKVSPDGKIVQLVVGDGLQLNQPAAAGAAGQVTHFHNVSAAEPLAGPEQSMRPRGGDVRELTLFELTHELRSSSPVISKNTLAAELYGRLARSLSVPFLPLLALPLGMAAKRGRRAPGLILASVLLIGFHHAVDMTQNLAQTGHAPPSAIWGIWLVFISLCSWLFVSSLKRPGDTPITRAVAAIDEWVHWLRDLFAPDPAKAAS
jgi:lipopolysaccharide export system permease protein